MAVCQNTWIENRQSNATFWSEKFNYVMTFGPRNKRSARKVKDVGHKQRATNGAFHSCGVNRVYYLCSGGHESCVFIISCIAERAHAQRDNSTIT